MSQSKSNRSPDRPSAPQLQDRTSSIYYFLSDWLYDSYRNPNRSRNFEAEQARRWVLEVRSQNVNTANNHNQTTSNKKKDMKSVGRVASNLWLALSSSRNNLASPVTSSSSALTSALTSNHNPKSMLTTMSMSASNVNEAATVSPPLTSYDAISRLSQYHPIVVEGMGYYDPRDPQTVASSIVASLQEHLHQQYTPTNDTTHKPLLVIIQGDPLAPRGISAITPLVANALSDQQRGLVCLDNHIADYHSKNADRNNVILEVKYS